MWERRACTLRYVLIIITILHNSFLTFTTLSCVEMFPLFALFALMACVRATDVNDATFQAELAKAFRAAGCPDVTCPLSFDVDLTKCNGFTELNYYGGKYACFASGELAFLSLATAGTIANLVTGHLDLTSVFVGGGFSNA